MSDLNKEELMAETRVVPAVQQGTENEQSSRRRRRTERYQEEGQEPVRDAGPAVRYVNRPTFPSGSETAREAANRMPVRTPERGIPGGRPTEAELNARRPEMERRETRERIGYEPGRMGSEYKRQIPSGAQQSRYSMNSDRQPARYAAQGEPARGNGTYAGIDEPEKKGHGCLTAAVVFVLVIGLAVIGLHLLPKETGGILGSVRDTVTGFVGKLINGGQNASAEIFAFEAVGNESVSSPADIDFTAKTGKKIEDVRLTDENGEQIDTTMKFTENTDHVLWLLTLHAEEEMTGTVRLQTRIEGEWKDTDKTAEIHVGPRAVPVQEVELASAAATDAPEPTELPVVFVTDTEEAADGGAGDISPSEETEEIEEWVADPDQGSTEDPSGDTADDGGADAENAEAAAAEEVPAGPVAEATDEPVPEQETELTAEPTSEPTAEPSPEPTPEPTPEPKLTAEACEEADPSLIKSVTVYNGAKKTSDYNRPAKNLITMPVAGEYTRKPMGVLTFRGDAFRQNAVCGTVENAEALEQVWSAETGSVKGSGQNYYGIGWTGQPAIVKWSKEVREKSSIDSAKREKSGLKEVIAAGLDGNIYFLDLEDGKPTRSAIKLGYPMKGTPSVHPGGYPYMNVGQFARKMAKGTGKIGLRQYNLYTAKESNLIDGLDGTQKRAFNSVGSFETSALIDRTSDTMITAGTNGLLYVISLGSEFDYQAGTYRTNPETVLLKTKAAGEKDAATAVESSIAMYDRYVFYADMGGCLRCVDTNKMKVVWAVDTEDSVESAVALDLNGGSLDLYTANLLNNRKKGDAAIRCYDAMSGREKWKVPVGVSKDTKKKTISGFLASPVIGQKHLSKLIYYTVNNLSDEGRAQLGVNSDAALIALNKADGSIKWTFALSGNGYSSPVAVYDEEGGGRIIQCSSDGSITMLDGLTGQTVSRLAVKGSIEASPAVYNDMMVVATTEKGANFIYGIKIR